MKLIIMLLLASNIVNAQTRYYVSSSGSNSNNGTSTGTPFLTIAKALSVTVSSDTISLNKGNVFNEKITVNASGLTFNYYGTGVNPLVTGFTTYTGFTNVTGNIWRKIVTASPTLNMVLVNDSVAHKARTPNTGYSTFTQGSSSDSTLVTSLTGTPDYTGYEVVARSSHWTTDVTKISSQSTGTLSLSPKLTYAPKNLGNAAGNGYFLQNDSSFVDTLNEYSYNATTGALVVYSVGSPTVKVSGIDTLVFISKKNNITFNGIDFTGANVENFHVDTSLNFTAKNCTITNCGGNAFTVRKSAYFTSDNIVLKDILSDGFLLAGKVANQFLTDTCNNATIKNCSLTNIGAIAGMGGSGNNQYMGIRLCGSNMIIRRNTFLNIGYIPVYFLGQYSTIDSNYINTFCNVKDDGSGINTFQSSGIIPRNYDSASVISDNIIINGIGALAGTSGCVGCSVAAGVYLDDSTRYVTVTRNTIANTFYASIFFNHNQYTTATYNTIFDSTNAIIRATGNIYTAVGLTFTNNIYYQKRSTGLIFDGDVKLTMVSDYNSFMRPSKDSIYNHLYSSIYLTVPHLWYDSTGNDLNSTNTPTAIASTTPTLYYNITPAAYYQGLTGSYVDPKGNVYTNYIYLRPFQSAMLFKLTTDVKVLRLTQFKTFQAL